MRRTILAAAALARLAVSTPAPIPQAFDLAAILSAPTLSLTAVPVGATGQSTIAYNTASAAASISTAVTSVATASSSDPSSPTDSPSSEKFKPRTDSSCTPEPQGSNGFKPYPDTASSFSKSPYFHALANSQPAFYGPYQQVFHDLNGSVSQNSYLTYYILPSYNLSQCAAYCDAVSLCTSFNIFSERDPSVNPGPSCPDPPSVTNYKCSLWGSSISSASATNVGQYRQDFHVVIAGSDGYDKTNSSVPPPTLLGGKFTFSVNLGSAAISLGGAYALGSEFYPGPYDPALCATYAVAQTEVNRGVALAAGRGTYTPVNFFDAYTVYAGGVAKGTYCVLFDTVLDASWAKFTGQWSGGVWFGVGSSYGYALSTQDSGSI